MTTISAGKLWALRRLADDDGFLQMIAIDQRPPIIGRLKAVAGEARDEDISAVKRVLAEVLAPHASAMLADPIWAYPFVHQHLSPRQGLILTLENYLAEETPGGRKSSSIPGWSVEKIRRMGGDGVKILAWYRPDAAADVIRHQQDWLRRIGEDCRRYDIPFVLELLVYPLPGEEGQGTGYAEQPGKRAEHVLESVRTFAAPDYGVDIFKLESPVPAESIPDPESKEAASVQALFDELGRLAGRPWVMLSAGAGPEPFRRVVTYAARAGASGYLAGRAIWWDAFRHFPDLDAMAAELRRTGLPYVQALQEIARRYGTPWHKHPAYGEGPRLAQAGTDFPETYPGMG